MDQSPPAESREPRAEGHSFPADSRQPTADSHVSPFLAHSFRLRDPWQCERDGDRVRWSRGFHRPTGLEDDDDLWLVISGLPEGAEVGLNGEPLAAPEGARHGQFLVTGLVVDNNRIEINVVASASPLPTADCPPPTAFPYDARLGVIGHS